jgi:hypothetical protein
LLLKQQDLFVGSPGKLVSSTYQPAQGDERRKNGRFGVSASADMLELRTRTHLSGRASDLGAGGCYIDTVSPFPVGTSLTIKLVSGNRSVAAKAAVVSAPAGMGMGLAFTEISADQKENLSAWLRELSGELTEEQTAADADVPYPQEAAIREPIAAAKTTGLGDALYELVLLLGTKGVLSEDQVERLRKKMDK